MASNQSVLTVQARGYTTKAGYARIDETLNNCATLYNAALQHRRDAWNHAGESVSFYDQCKELTLLRKDDPYWAGLSIQITRGVIRRAQRAYDGFFRRVKSGRRPGFPRFKPRARYRTFEIFEVSPSMLKSRRNGYAVKVKGLPTINLYPGRELPPIDQVKSLQLTRRKRTLDVSIQFTFTSEPLPSNGRIIALDPGVSRRLTGSDGYTSMPLKRDRNSSKVIQREISLFRERALADGRAQWAPVLTRWGTWQHTSHAKQRFRLEWTSGQEPLKLRRLKERLATLRHRDKVRARNITHEITTELVRNYDIIGIEDTALRNMTRSASGTPENPGRNVAARTGLNRAVLEQALGLIRNQLQYKAEWAGKSLVKVPAEYTTQNCSRCLSRNPRPGPDRTYRCKRCCLEIDQDANAAVNILHATQAAAGIDRGNRPLLFEYGVAALMDP